MTPLLHIYLMGDFQLDLGDLWPDSSESQALTNLRKAYVQLMRLQALLGDRAAALRTYHTCVTVLARELGGRAGTRDFVVLSP